MIADEDAALAQIARFLLVGFLERQRAGCPAPAVQKFSVPIDLHFHAPRAMIAELAIQLPAILADGPEVFTRPPLTWRGRAIGRVEGLVASSRRDRVLRSRDLVTFLLNGWLIEPQEEGIRAVTSSRS